MHDEALSIEDAFCELNDPHRRTPAHDRTGTLAAQERRPWGSVPFRVGTVLGEN